MTVAAPQATLTISADLVARAEVPLRPWSMNDRLHKMAEAKLRKLWREDGGLIACHVLRQQIRAQGIDLPLGFPVLLEILPAYAGRRLDALNEAKATKALVDGLRDGRILRNDSAASDRGGAPKYVSGYLVQPPVLADRDSLTISLWRLRA